jgi:hypothetical protein
LILKPIINWESGETVKRNCAGASFLGTGVAIPKGVEVGIGVTVGIGVGLPLGLTMGVGVSVGLGVMPGPLMTILRGELHAPSTSSTVHTVAIPQNRIEGCWRRRRMVELMPARMGLLAVRDLRCFYANVTIDA